MEEKLKLIECNDDDVIEFGNKTYKVSKMRQAVNESSNQPLAYALQRELSNKGVKINQKPSDNWFEKGIDCEFLNLGSKSWKKGKVKLKLSVEFYVEEEDTEIKEPESPLDDLRRKINEATS
ncbi:MAG: hypothetical protein RLZZ507_3589 [Cyanobacteriota bacterium]|jgi:hypothetical protein